MTHVVPVCGGTGYTLGRVLVHYRGPVPELVVATTWHGVPVYLPCRRVNRVTDPTQYYIAADGTLFRARDAVPTAPVWAAVDVRPVL